MKFNIHSLSVLFEADNGFQEKSVDKFEAACEKSGRYVDVDDDCDSLLVTIDLLEEETVIEAASVLLELGVKHLKENIL